MKAVSFFVAVTTYVLLAACVVGAYLSSPSFSMPVVVNGGLNPAIVRDVFVLPCWLVLALYISGMYRPETMRSLVATLVKVAVAIAAGMSAYLLLQAIFSYSLTGRFVLAYMFMLGTITIVAVRQLYSRLCIRFARKVVLLGGPLVKQEILNDIVRLHLPIVVVEGHEPVFGEAPSDIQFRDVDEIIVDTGVQLHSTLRMQLMNSMASGIGILDVNALYESRFERVYFPALDERWFWSHDPVRNHAHYLVVKRAFDLLISLVGLAVALPLLPLIALAIKLQDGGPVLYSQIRTGLYGRPFQIWKFRTMSINAEAQGAQWAKKNDPRTTTLGRFMRKTRIDELPQLWNIIIGEMSFVGPRPERPEFLSRLECEIPFYRYRHLIKPGLTGWAQINYPYGASVEDAKNKLTFDLYYLKYASINLDAIIFLRTIGAIMKGSR